MADTAYEDEEVKDGVHEAALVEAVEGGTGDVCHSLSYYPDYRCGAHRVDKWLEGHEHRQSHTHKTKGLYVAVLLKMSETDYGARYGT